MTTNGTEKRPLPNKKQDPANVGARRALPLHTMDHDGERPLPSGWEWTTIADLILPNGVFSDGDWVESKDQDPNGNVRLIQLADIGDGFYRDRSSRYLTHDKAIELKCTFLEKGDVLVARMPDPLGRACLFPGDVKKSVTVVDVCIIRTGLGSVNHRWLMNWVNSPIFRNKIDALQSGTTRKRIARRKLATIQFPLPPLEEQERIVAEIEKQFTRLDQAVASLKRLQSNLARYKASVLKAACEGRLVPQDPNDEPAGQLLERILAERRAQWEAQEWENLIVKAQKKAAQAQRKAQGLPARIKDLQPGEWEAIPEAAYARYLPKHDKWKGKYKEPAGVETAVLPDLPEGWVWASLAQFIAKIEAGKSPKTQNRPVKSNEIGVIKVSAMSWGEFLPEENKALIENSKPKNMPSIKSGDLLISRANTVELVGAVVLVKNDHPNLLLSDKSLRLVPSSDLIAKSYLLYALRAPWVRERFENRATGTSDSMRNLSQGKILSAPISVPPFAEQKRIVAEVERRLSVVAATEQAITTNLARAERLRQSILGRAFTGQLVPQAIT